MGEGERRFKKRVDSQGGRKLLEIICRFALRVPKIMRRAGRDADALARSDPHFLTVHPKRERAASHLEPVFLPGMHVLPLAQTVRRVDAVDAEEAATGLRSRFQKRHPLTRVRIVD